MAYVNCTIDQGGFGSFQVDAAGALSLYQRVKFTTTPNTADGSGKPTIVACAATERAIGIVMQPGAVGQVITVRFNNAQGEQFGISSGTIGLGVAVYGAASGAVSAASGGGALLLGIATTPGYDGGPMTYLPSVAAA